MTPFSRRSREIVGQPIDQYLIEATLGEGGMGIFYLALDLVLGRPVAIKIVYPFPGREGQLPILITRPIR